LTTFLASCMLSWGFPNRFSKLFFIRALHNWVLCGSLVEKAVEKLAESDTRAIRRLCKVPSPAESWIQQSQHITQEMAEPATRAAHERCDAGGGRGRSHRMSTPFSTVSIQTYAFSSLSLSFLGMMGMLYALYLCRLRPL
jgi:hypothetical protein